MERQDFSPGATDISPEPENHRGQWRVGTQPEIDWDGPRKLHSTGREI